MNDITRKQRTVMMTDDRAKQRSYYCTVRQQAIITRRAKAAGMSRSAFMVACALHDEPVGAELMPAADEQRALLDHLSATVELVTRLMAPSAGSRHVRARRPRGALQPENTGDGPMRRPQRRQGKYSLSCTDEDWKRIRARASHAGMTVSAFIVQAALAIDPSRSRMDLSRAREQHEAIMEAARRVMAHLPPAPPEKAATLWSTLHRRITFLVRMAMDNMLDEGRRDDLERRLDRQFGAGSGERMVTAHLESRERPAMPE